MDTIVQSLLLYIKKLFGFYHWEKVQVCPLCGAQGFKSHSEHRYGLLSIRLKMCRSCNLVVQSPRLTEKSLDKFYRGEYGYRWRKKMDTDHCEKMFERGFRRGAYICKFLDENGIKYKGSVVLEVGCAYGGILEQFRRLGCHVKGCDVSSIAVQYGVSKGLDLMVGPVDLLADLDYKADLVILSHVLEHIADPNLFLKKLRQTLKPDGVLYVEVPGIKNPRIQMSRCAQIGHLLYFNQDTVRKMVEKSGFRFISGNEIVQSIFCMM